MTRRGVGSALLRGLAHRGFATISSGMIAPYDLQSGPPAGLAAVFSARIEM